MENIQFLKEGLGAAPSLTNKNPDWEVVKNFPCLSANNDRLLQVCVELGAEQYRVGRSGFAARNSVYIWVGGEATKSNLEFSSALIRCAMKILECEKISCFEDEFLQNSLDGGVSGWTLTGGDGSRAGRITIQQHVPHYVFVGNYRWANTQDHRQGRSHTEKTFFINKNKVPAGENGVLVIRVHDKDKFCFIGKGGQNIKSLQDEIGVSKIIIQEPEFNEENFQVFFKHAMDGTGRLSERFKAWKDIFNKNKETIIQYYNLVVRSGGELSFFAEDMLTEHYKNVFYSKRIMSLDVLCSLIRKGELQELDMSELMARQKEIEEKNPDKMNVSGSTFSIMYRKHGHFSLPTYEVLTHVTREELDSGILRGGITLPSGRRVEIVFKERVNNRDQEYSAYTSTEVIAKANDYYANSFGSSVHVHAQNTLNHLLPERVRRHEKYHSSVLSQLGNKEFSYEIPIWDTKVHYETLLNKAKESIEQSLRSDLGQVFAACTQIDKFVDSLKSFREGLSDEECNLLSSELFDLDKVEQIIQLLLNGRNTEAVEGLEVLFSKLDYMTTKKEQVLSEKNAELDALRANLPKFLADYFSSDLLLAGEIYNLTRALKQKLERMKGQKEYYARELSVGKGRRKEAMQKLVQGMTQFHYSICERLICLAGTNGIGIESFLAEYLFDEQTWVPEEGYKGDISQGSHNTGDSLGDLLPEVFKNLKDKI